MNIENQLCSLELSRKLEKLGVKQESIFYWADGILVSRIEMELLLEDNTARTLSSIYNDWPDRKISELYSAFSVAELGEMLPSGIVQTDICPRDLGRYALYLAGSVHHEFDNNEANARAKMLIYLIENKLIDHFS